MISIQDRDARETGDQNVTVLPNLNQILTYMHYCTSQILSLAVCINVEI